MTKSTHRQNRPPQAKTAQRNRNDESHRSSKESDAPAASDATMRKAFGSKAAEYARASELLGRLASRAGRHYEALRVGGRGGGRGGARIGPNRGPPGGLTRRSVWALGMSTQTHPRWALERLVGAILNSAEASRRCGRDQSSLVEIFLSLVETRRNWPKPAPTWSKPSHILATVSTIRAVRPQLARKGGNSVETSPELAEASDIVVENRLSPNIAAGSPSLNLSGGLLEPLHPLMPCVVRHTAWLGMRYVVRPSGCAVYEAMPGRSCRSEFVELCEQVSRESPIRAPPTRSTAGGRPIGASDEHLVSIQACGMLCMRAIHRTPEPEPWSLTELDHVRGAPWKLTPRADAAFEHTSYKCPSRIARR